MSFKVKISLKLVGDSVALTIVREGTQLVLEVTAEQCPELVPLVWYGSSSYCLFAGFVFVPATYHRDDDNFENVFEQTDICIKIGYYKAESKRFDDARQQVVHVATILPHTLMLGYERSTFMYESLLEIDDHPVVCLADVHRLLSDAKGPFVSLGFTQGKKAVLPLSEACEATAELMNEHGITKASSSDVETSEADSRKSASKRAAEDSPAALTVATEASLTEDIVASTTPSWLLLREITMSRSSVR